jgi:hypothetical protein
LLPDFSSSAVVGVKYDWNFFMVVVMVVVTIGPGRTKQRIALTRVSPGTPCHLGCKLDNVSGPDAWSVAVVPWENILGCGGRGTPEG